MSELVKTLRNYADSDYLPMHMPGHKRRLGAGEMGDPFFIDITEIEGTDNLHHAEGVLKHVQEQAAELYHSEETHYLVNGSTCGILTAISGCVSRGGTILLARNSHKSAYHGVMLRNLSVKYLYPQSTGDLGINGAIDPADVEKMLEQDPSIEAVMITSPTYDGVVSDVRKIAEMVHKRGIPLIVDEAHGAHFPFSEQFPEDSVTAGADVVIHSLHKTLPSLTQTALIHFNGNRIDRERLRYYLTVYQSSSPSYILMSSMDLCMDWVREHRQAFEDFCERLKDFREMLGSMKHLELLEVSGMDRSKILISVRHTSMSGEELSDRLRQNYHIELEMAALTYVCAITTVADGEDELKRFGHALMEIDAELEAREHVEESKVQAENTPEMSEQSMVQETRQLSVQHDRVIPTEQVISMGQAQEQTSIWMPLQDAVGKVSAGFVTPYPPGIPVLTPGERVSRAIIERLEACAVDGLVVEGYNEGAVKVLCSVTAKAMSERG